LTCCASSWPIWTSCWVETPHPASSAIAPIVRVIFRTELALENCVRPPLCSATQRC